MDHYEPPREPIIPEVLLNDAEDDNPYRAGSSRPDALEPEAPAPRRRVVLPVLLFLGTCLSTYALGGLAYCVPLMFTLLCHELGHFVQAWRYGVPASLPYFIPMPGSFFGTMGAVIGMRGNLADRKELFDIAITGPLVGLVPALIFSAVGLHWSTVKAIVPDDVAVNYIGEPLVFKALIWLIKGPIPEGQDVVLHPMGYAGWVGLFVTAFNLIPFSQLDGGHILYALLRRRSYPVVTILYVLAVFVVVATRQYQWSLLLFLILIFGPRHPPTRNDSVELGPARVVLGWLTLAYFIVGFTPVPF